MQYSNKCPICGEQVLDGFICTGRYLLQWRPIEQRSDSQYWYVAMNVVEGCVDLNNDPKSSLYAHIVAIVHIVARLLSMHHRAELSLIIR